MLNYNWTETQGRDKLSENAGRNLTFYLFQALITNILPKFYLNTTAVL